MTRNATCKSCISPLHFQLGFEPAGQSSSRQNLSGHCPQKSLKVWIPVQRCNFLVYISPTTASVVARTTFLLLPIVIVFIYTNPDTTVRCLLTSQIFHQPARPLCYSLVSFFSISAKPLFTSTTMGLRSLVSLGFLVLPIAVTLGVLLGLQAFRESRGMPPPFLSNKVETNTYCQIATGISPATHGLQYTCEFCPSPPFAHKYASSLTLPTPVCFAER